jgi:hypothetical protein
VRRVLVDGKARKADRDDSLGPSGTALLVGIASEPFDRQGLTAHRRDEIANLKILDACFALRGQDVRASNEAVRPTVAAATVATSAKEITKEIAEDTSFGWGGG